MSEWISVKDRLPKKFKGQDYAAVLFCVHPIVSPNRVCAGRYFFGKKHPYKWISLQGAGFYDKSVTHWMPLPEPPK